MAEDVCCLKAQLKEKEEEIAALKNKLAQLGKVRQTQLTDWMNGRVEGDISCAHLHVEVCFYNLFASIYIQQFSIHGAANYNVTKAYGCLANKKKTKKQISGPLTRVVTNRDIQV